MISKTTPQFWEHFAKLPREIQKLANKGYVLWKENPQHPSLRFKPLKGKSSLYSVRVGIHYRALAWRDGDLVVWTWIGHHHEYDDLIK